MNTTSDSEIVAYRDGDPVYELTDYYNYVHGDGAAEAVQSLRRLCVVVSKLPRQRQVTTYDRVGRARKVTCTHEITAHYLSSRADGTDRDFCCVSGSMFELLTRSEARKFLRAKVMHDHVSPDL